MDIIYLDIPSFSARFLRKVVSEPSFLITNVDTQRQLSRVRSLALNQYNWILQLFRSFVASYQPVGPPNLFAFLRCRMYKIIVINVKNSGSFRLLSSNSFKLDRYAHALR